MTQNRRRVVAANRSVTSEELLEGLNPEQREVVEFHKGALLVGAAAGTGKTTALTKRIAFLSVVRGVAPSRILALTFSNKAAREMNERLVKLVPNSGARVGTFHSLALQFIREEIPEISPNQRGGAGGGSWELDERDRYRGVVKDVLGFRGMKWDAADLTVVLQFIGRCKAMCALPGSERAEELASEFFKARPCGQRSPELLAEAYWRAEDLRKERRLLTFDDMLLEMWARLVSDEQTRIRWAARWEFVLQDECQDENLVQREIASMLARDHGNYMIVGDPAQAIYGVRGADPTGLLTFEKVWNAKVIRMHRNYRCGTAIADAANGTLGAMPEGTHLGIKITAERDATGTVDSKVYVDADEEGEGIVARMIELRADGVKWSEMCVLYRTNAQSRPLEESCLGNRVPYVVIGGTNFYDRQEVKQLLSYLRIAAGRATFEDVRRSINAPFRYLGKAFVDRIEMFAQRAGGSRSDGGGVDWTDAVRAVLDGAGLQQRQRVSALEWCTLIDTHARRISAGRAASSNLETAAVEARPAVILEDILLATDYVKWLTRDEGTESPENNRASTVRELVRAAGRFNTVDALLEYIEETLEAARAAKAGEATQVERVTMMSIHRSKGLEFPAVFLVGANDKILPHAKCEDVNEERRLFYVACTRAKDYLHVSAVSKAAIGTRVADLHVSVFLAEAGIVPEIEEDLDLDGDDASTRLDTDGLDAVEA